MQAFKGWNPGVDFDDDPVSPSHDLGSNADSECWHDSPVLGNTARLNDADIQLPSIIHCVETVSKILRKHGKMPVSEINLSLIDRNTDCIALLMRPTPIKHTQL